MYDYVCYFKYKTYDCCLVYALTFSLQYLEFPWMDFPLFFCFGQVILSLPVSLQPCLIRDGTTYTYFFF